MVVQSVGYDAGPVGLCALVREVGTRVGCGVYDVGSVELGTATMVGCVDIRVGTDAYGAPPVGLVVDTRVGCGVYDVGSVG